MTKRIPADSGVAFTLPTNRLFQVEPGRLPRMQIPPRGRQDLPAPHQQSN